MLIAVILVFSVIICIVALTGGILKKILEVISLIAKLGVGGFVAILISQAFSIKFSSQWKMFLFVLAGAAIFLTLLMLLSKKFRLVGYSVNYFINSFTLLLITAMISSKISPNFITYALSLFLFPRLMWISDRLATYSEYSHSEYNFWENVTTNFYVINDMDWWGDSADSWDHIPLQIVIASIFYLVGSITLEFVCPFSSGWLEALYFILSTAINVVFDLFVFRAIEEANF